DALVLAGMHLIAEVERERQARVLRLALSHGEGERQPPALQTQAQARFGGMKTVVEDVQDRPTVDGAEQVADPHAGRRRRAARLHLRHGQRVDRFQKNLGHSVLLYRIPAPSATRVLLLATVLRSADKTKRQREREQ